MRCVLLMFLLNCCITTDAQQNYFKLFKIEFIVRNQQPISLDYSNSFDYARLDLTQNVFDVPSFPQYRYRLLSRSLTSSNKKFKKFEGNALIEKQRISYSQEEFSSSDRNIFTFYLSNGGKTVFTCSITPYKNEKIDLDKPFGDSGPLDSTVENQASNLLSYEVQEVITRIGGEEKPLINLRGKNVQLIFDTEKNLVSIPAIKSSLTLFNLQKVVDDNSSIMYKGIATEAGTTWDFTYYINKELDWTIFEIASRNEKGTSTAYLCKRLLDQNDEIISKPNSQFQASGTGFFLNTDGYIATNAHVVDELHDITVTVNYKINSITYRAKVIAVDKDHDLALLKIVSSDFTKLDQIPYGFSATTDVGERVFTIGYPLDDIMGGNYKLADGIVSSLTGIADDPKYLQISIPLLPGNSGGPLFNSNGEVIGLSTSRLAGEKIGIQVDNVGYAIKTKYLINLMEQSGIHFIFKSQLGGLQLKDQVKQVKNYVVVIKGIMIK